MDWLEDDYQNAVLCGVADAAREHDLNLLCFAGGVLDSPTRFGVQRNAIYALPGPENVDALLVMSGTLGNEVGPERLTGFCRRFEPLPMCSIAWALPGIPSVLVDNATGMRQALEHLIEVHQAADIAFIRGPEVNIEAERRYSVYREVLAEYGLARRPELTVTGDFQQAGGSEAVRVLFEERRLRPRAIVATNDYMALGAIDALRRLGLRVPEDVLVIGFDDVEEAQFSNPTLTTVRQPLYEQGIQAVETVLAKLAGEPLPERVVLHTELVLRHSCGCHALALSSPNEPPSYLPPAPSEPPAARRERLVTTLGAALPKRGPGLELAWEEDLAEAFLSDLATGRGGTFLGWLDEKLEKIRRAGGDLKSWHAVLDTLRRGVLRTLAPDPVQRARAEELCHAARQTLGAAIERAQAEQRLRTERWARTLSRTGEALITAFDVISLVNAIAEQFPRLEIGSSYLSLYEAGGKPMERARLVLAYDGGMKLGPDAPPTSYPSRELVPRDMMPRERRHAYVVEPLFFRDEQLGFVLFEMGPREGVVYEALRDELSAALKGALLVHQVVEKDQERQRLLRDLERRARQLEEAYQALRDNQDKMLTQEKMASLGRLTASIAHEMNTPLAAVRTALVELERLTEEYAASRNDPEVTLDDHAQIAEEMFRAIRLATSSSRRAADFVRGIKTQTRDLSPAERMAFEAVPYIREALLLLTYALRQASCRTRFEPEDEHIKLVGSPGRLAQIVTNLVTNAIDASVAKGGGIVEIELTRRPSDVILRVTDSGSGIEPHLMGRIFDPMFTTKPLGQGTGLGLSIVRDVVTRDFGGTVQVVSTPGLGTTFTVTFPDLGAARP